MVQTIDLEPDEIVVRAPANMLVRDARLNRLAKVILGFAFLGAGDSVLGAFASHQGGLWVGGEVRIFRDKIVFEQNALNRAFHEGEIVKTVYMKDVAKVLSTRKFRSDLVSIEYSSDARAGIMKLRCYRSSRVAETVESLSADIISRAANS